MLGAQPLDIAELESTPTTKVGRIKTSPETEPSRRGSLTRRASLPIAWMLKKMVGTAGFEPATTTPPVWCATRLRYAPKVAKYTGKGADRES